MNLRTLGRRVFLLAGFGVTASFPAAGASPELVEGLRQALSRYPGIQAQASRVEAAGSMATAETAPMGPSIGYSQVDGPMPSQYLMLTQEIDFPLKYVQRSKANSHREKAEAATLVETRYRVRSDFLTAYYGWFAAERTIDLVRRDIQKLRELSRTAESRYAAGTDPQHESMKAHVAQTEAESSLIELRSQRDARLARVLELTGSEASTLGLPEKPLPVPALSAEKFAQARTRLEAAPAAVRSAEAVESAQALNALGKLEFAPDFMLRYETKLSGDMPDDRKISAEISIPLWFWGPAGRASAASSELDERQSEREVTLLQLRSRFDALSSDVQARAELLKILETSLIPQALTTYSTTTAGYRANKARFLDVLDAERSLLRIQIQYYRTLVEYVGSLTELEAILGTSVSDLPGVES